MAEEIDDMLGGTEEVAGWVLTFGGDGQIVRAETPEGRVLRVGQRVVANGRFGARKGTAGWLEEIARPYEKGRTSDVLKVRLDGQPCVTSLKTEDLEP